jgi:peptidoglycan/LPS O-acetylase OafA/YrhL
VTFQLNHVNMRLYLAKIPYTQGLPSQLVSSLVWNGQYGVQMFFAVSGFLIAALTYHLNLLEAHRGYLPGHWDILWSLSVEEMFYLFFAPVCWLLVYAIALGCLTAIATLRNVRPVSITWMMGGLGTILVAFIFTCSWCSYSLKRSSQQGSHLPPYQACSSA